MLVPFMECKNWIDRDDWAYLGFQEGKKEAKGAGKTKIKKKKKVPGWYKHFMVTVEDKIQYYESNAQFWITKLQQNVICNWM